MLKLDANKAKTLLGWEPKFSLKDGLVETIQWFVENHRIEGKVNQESLSEHN